MSTSSSSGSKIQEALYKELAKVTRFVRSEPSTVRYDMAAYIPEDQYVGFKEKQETFCWRLVDRFYCREMLDALREETEVPYEEREAQAKAKCPPEKLAEFEDHRYYYLNDIPKYRLGEKEYSEWGHLYTAHRDCCQCYDAHSCPTWTKMRRRQLKSTKGGLHMPGLHLFEVKSDKDNYTRLVHQLPSMYGLADWAWLVLGEKQEIPVWLPPWIGVLRFIEKGKKFKVVRRGRQTHKAPTLYRQVLGPHDTSMSLAPWVVHQLWRKWAVNSLFWFQTQQIVLDMTDELKALGQISKWVKNEGLDLKLTQKRLIEFDKEENDEVPLH